MNPYAGETISAPPGNTVAGKQPDRCLFQGPQKPVQVFCEERQIENGVDDELTGAVDGDVAAPVNTNDPYALFMQKLRRDQQVIRRACPADGVDGIKLGEKQAMPPDALLNFGDEAGLDAAGETVVRQSEIKQFALHKL